MTTNRPSLVIFSITLFLITSHSLSFTNYQSLFSISHSLITRVANLRLSRGDAPGSARARLIAQKLERGLGLGFWGVMGSMGWDYLKNYAWRDLDITSSDMFRLVSDVNDLMKSLNELTRMDSQIEKAAWVQRNYRNVLRLFNSLFATLLKLFRKSGPLREAMETVQREVLEGDLLRDCLEVGSKDLKGLTQIFKDMVSQFASTHTSRSEL